MKLQSEENKGSKRGLTAANHFLMAGGVSVEDRSKRAETVRPRHDELCECQFVYDGALSAKSDKNDVELNGETDDGGRGDRV